MSREATNFVVPGKVALVPGEAQFQGKLQFQRKLSISWLQVKLQFQGKLPILWFQVKLLRFQGKLQLQGKLQFQGELPISCFQVNLQFQGKLQSQGKLLIGLTCSRATYDASPLRSTTILFQAPRAFATIGFVNNSASHSSCKD